MSGVREISVELWELAGPWWTLPIRVVWAGKNLGEVRIGGGIRLLDKQIAEAEKLLESLGCERAGNTFYAARPALERAATRSLFDDPEDVVEWRPDRTKAEAGEKYDPGEFIKGYTRAPYAIVRDPLVADAVWASFCKWIFHCLVNNQSPVSLEFCELTPLPLRRDWLARVARRDYASGSKEAMSPNYASMVARGVAGYMATGYMAEWDGETVGWTLEVTTNGVWESGVKRLEMYKRELRGDDYLEEAQDATRRLLPKAMEIYADYIEKAGRPSMAILSGHSRRVAAQCGWFPAQVAARGGGGWSATGVSFARVANGQPGDVAPADAGVPAVPDLQPAEADLRDGW